MHIALKTCSDLSAVDAVYSRQCCLRGRKISHEYDTPITNSRLDAVTHEQVQNGISIKRFGDFAYLLSGHLQPACWHRVRVAPLEGINGH